MEANCGSVLGDEKMLSATESAGELVVGDEKLGADGTRGMVDLLAAAAAGGGVAAATSKIEFSTSVARPGNLALTRVLGSRRLELPLETLSGLLGEFADGGDGDAAGTAAAGEAAAATTAAAVAVAAEWSPLDAAALGAACSSSAATGGLPLFLSGAGACSVCVMNRSRPLRMGVGACAFLTVVCVGRGCAGRWPRPRDAPALYDVYTRSISACGGAAVVAVPPPAPAAAVPRPAATPLPVAAGAGAAPRPAAPAGARVTGGTVPGGAVLRCGGRVEAALLAALSADGTPAPATAAAPPDSWATWLKHGSHTRTGSRP